MPNIKIIKQTPDYLVLNKPSGISVHGDGKSPLRQGFAGQAEQETLTDWLLENFPEVEGVGEDLGNIKKPGIVHRLDKETSGVILIALNQKSYEHFKKQFKNREIKKVYNFFAYGNIRDDLFTVDEPIGKDRKDFRKRTTKNPRGRVRESQTDFKILNRGEDKGEIFIYGEARPKTGRTHQIRVHLKHKNTPIVCDHLYASKRKSILGFERLALHAKSLFFTDLEGKGQVISADFPSDFETAVAKLNT